MKILKSALIIVGLLTIVFVSVNATQQAPNSKIQEYVKTNANDRPVKDYNIYALPMPENINFAGEEVPLDDPDIYERMDRELLVNTYWQSNALLLIKRANKYFPIIEPILKEEGVPDDFKYLAVIESGLTQAVSPAGARGFWQIMKGTGRDYGLEINDNVDERYHIEKSTRVAADYLKRSKAKFGSWTMAAAAYNAGNRGVERQLERQKVDDYYELLLNTETGRYMFRILALKEILTNPEQYGFNFEEKHLYKNIPTRTVKVDTVVNDFADFAKHFNINYKILKIHNPWLREAHLNNASRKEYEIKIPEENSYTAVK
ncbi:MULTISPECIES: lytic transglycosylase domain-containing protein [Salegentibacter]|uniref:lytic transglycosylase domain-containing protein n=1 Tax=Salegentibacter TaxID=143222 RepID=UPI00187B2729|nr:MULTISPECIES: lytic transglycosylase domain-containing protein [Salegentibacter]MBE7638983.1 transglycosylase SLT domain-containing protein [Salegentibacter sp. BLCTC]MBI6115323.1 lytic transglycosylase domain-containing protein [Salegentibacter maritimus]